jgi:segregation and condensation protein B
MEEREVDGTDRLVTAQRLGENYARLLGNRDWQIEADNPGGLSDVEGPDGLPNPFAIEAEPKQDRQPVVESNVADSLPKDPQPIVSPTSESSQSPTPIPVAKKKPPIAEAANESSIPPTPLQIVEALLFTGGAPLTAEHAADAVRGLGAEQFRDCVETLNRVYKAQNRPYDVVHSPAGYSLRVKPRYTQVREKLFGGPREARLNQNALDVVSLIAYRQPIGRSEIDAIRGADSATVIRQLSRLGLVAQTNDHEGEPLYSTTDRFLEVFRLRDLDDLPRFGEPTKVI